VIYHSGNGSSFEDNSVLCEFLASHGYVVLGSAFQEPSGKSFNVDNGQTRDFEFLIAYAQQRPNADWNHVGVIGHSAGAHAALTFRSQSNCAADAIVSLDTTQDYYSVTDTRWEPMITAVTKNRKYVTGPLLMVANPHAYFQLADSLSSARRYYLTIKDLDHNDFISQGCIGHELRYKLRFESSVQPQKSLPDQADAKTKLDAVKAGYTSLCDYILTFLNAELKGEAKAKDNLVTRYRNTKLGSMEAHVEYAPEGCNSPEAYAATSSQIPTPRQLRYFLSQHGCDQTIALLRRHNEESSDAPIYHHVFGLALVGDLLDQGRKQDAVSFRDYYRNLGIDCDKVLLAWGNTYLRLGNKRLAADFFKKVILLDASNTEAVNKLKECEESEKKSEKK
jgi:hypothetical protein